MFAGYQWRQAEIQKIRALRESSEALLNSNQQLDALFNILQAGKSLNHPLLKVFSSNDLRSEVTKSLRKVFYQVKERNRIKKPVGSLVSITPDHQIMVAENIKEPIEYLLDSEGNRVIPFPGFQAALNPVNYSPGIIYSPDSRFIAIADIDDAPWNKDKYGTVSLWDRQTNTLTQLTRHKGGVKSIGLSPNSKKIATADGKKLATANQDGTVGLWDLESQNSLRLIKRFSHGDMLKLKKIEEIIKVDFSPDSNKLVFVSKGVDQEGSSASVVSLWNLRSKKIQLEKEIVSFDVVIFNAKNELLFINTDRLEDTTRFFDLNKNEVLKFKYGSPCPIYNDQNISNSEKSGLIASAKDDKVCLWDVEGNYLASFKVPQGKINDISFNSDGSLMAIAVDNGSILLWNIGELDKLMTWGCNWIKDYLKTNPNVNDSNRHLCDGIGTQN
jgi:WD40 repeat protein